jgi:hypothetical protein
MSEQMQSEIAEISRKIDEIEDPRRSYALVQERIQRMRRSGVMIPKDLERIERQLLVECLAESQGR